MAHAALDAGPPTHLSHQHGPQQVALRASPGLEGGQDVHPDLLPASSRRTPHAAAGEVRNSRLPCGRLRLTALAGIPLAVRAWTGSGTKAGGKSMCAPQGSTKRSSRTACSGRAERGEHEHPNRSTGPSTCRHPLPCVTSAEAPRVVILVMQRMEPRRAAFAAFMSGVWDKPSQTPAPTWAACPRSGSLTGPLTQST